ncbi:MAG: hypothetical protein E3J70_04745 [Candidatus Heimdallarchaeota archaeon]|nr:MAG: hypothetical protein E3J70_04745 [Candidatus Heimdallarchaeota archaeon]
MFARTKVEVILSELSELIFTFILCASKVSFSIDLGLRGEKVFIFDEKSLLIACALDSIKLKLIKFDAINAIMEKIMNNLILREIML